jgi:hypothetical protein
MARCPLGQLMAGLQSGPSSWGQPKVVAKHLLAKFLGEDLLLPLKQKFLTKRTGFGSTTVLTIGLNE